MLRFIAALSLLVLVGCGSTPPPLPAPSVFESVQGSDWSYVVADIYAAEGAWSWTAKRPTVRVTVPTGENVRYMIRFGIPEGILARTGPLSVQFFINDHILDTVAYSKPGTIDYEKEVPVDWVPQGSEVILGAEIDKVHTVPPDQRQLGFVLTKIGLIAQ